MPQANPTARPEARPKVSVIIATYQWSSALRCALGSVLRQRFQDFEVLVVGDGCTDDSEAVVRSFGDARLRWENLPANSGGQSTPNNRGFALSSGEFIAYLGHDDIWHPDHLASLLRVMAGGAELGIAACLIYGPPASGVRLVSGLFDPSGFTRRDSAPPSSMMLRRDLLTRIGPWRDAKTIRLPVDYDLLLRALEAGTRIVGTDELTVFKFNAAFRRDAYRRKDTGEQEAMLARIDQALATGTDFRLQEWAQLARCFLTGRSWPSLVPEDIDKHPEGALNARNLAFKGVTRSVQRHPPLSLPQRWALTSVDALGFEWHELEQAPKFGSFRWSGPSTESTLTLPVSSAQDLVIEMHILHIAAPELLTGLRLDLNGRATGGTIDPTSEGSWLLRTRYSAEAASPDHDGVRVTLRLPWTRSFFQTGRGSDIRPVGIAVNWIQASPIQAGPTAPPPGAG